MEPRTLLIDGYNVIRRTPGLAHAEQASMAAGRDALIHKVASTFRQTAHTVIVVFDGDGPTETQEPLPRCRGRVIYTRDGESADAVIRRIADEEAGNGRAPHVYTDDLDVRLSVEASGGQSSSVAELTRRAHAPDKYRARQAQHQARIRQELEDDRANDPGSRRGNPRRKPKRRGK